MNNNIAFTYLREHKTLFNIVLMIIIKCQVSLCHLGGRMSLMAAF